MIQYSVPVQLFMDVEAVLLMINTFCLLPIVFKTLALRLARKSKLNKSRYFMTFQRLCYRELIA